MAAPAIRIGVLHDFPSPDGGRSFERNARAGMQPVVDRGALPDDVELVHAVGLGLPLPGGSAHAVERAFAELVDQGVVAILGPAISDNALVVRPLADEARIPCINYTGSEETRSEYMFQFQIGSLEEEPSVLAAHLAAQGFTRVCVARDRSYVGRRMAEFFDDAAAVEGLELVARDHADAIVSLGLWDGARALAAERPSQPVVANSALIFGHHDPGAAREWDGWVYPDTVSEGNRIYAALGEPGPAGAGQHDLGRLVAEGIARARALIGRYVMEGLERVKSIPSATGEDGTRMGFGRHDRGALVGRYLVLRRWVDGRSEPWA